MATVTGTAVDPTGAPINGGTIRFSANPAAVVASGSNTLFPRDVSTTISAVGAISVVLAEGSYIGRYVADSGYTAEFGLAVPAGTTATFNACLIPLVSE